MQPVQASSLDLASELAARRAPAAQRNDHSKGHRLPPPWPTIESFLESEQGDISIGSIGYTAVASDEHHMLVGLARRPGESAPTTPADPREKLIVGAVDQTAADGEIPCSEALSRS